MVNAFTPTSVLPYQGGGSIKISRSARNDNKGGDKPRPYIPVLSLRPLRLRFRLSILYGRPPAHQTEALHQVTQQAMGGADADSFLGDYVYVFGKYDLDCLCGRKTLL